MAKSVEQKMVDTIIAGMDSKSFRPAEFSRLMATETLPAQHFTFMGLIMGYMNYLATFSAYGYHPNNLYDECVIAEQVAPIMNAEMQRLARLEGDML